MRRDQHERGMFGTRKTHRKRITILVLDVTREFLRNRGIEVECSLNSDLSLTIVGLDSIGHLELLAEIERCCEIEIPERYWGDLSKITIENLIELVVKIS